MKKPHKLFPVNTIIAEKPITKYLELPSKVFDFPFFNEGVQEIIKREKSRTHKTPQDIKNTSRKDLLELKGFIFHTSHCGSTLLVRMLQTVPYIRVISETEAINGLLLAYKLHDLPKKHVQEQLKTIIESYCQPLYEEKYVVFKFTSWNVFMIDLFKELYPTTKSIYIDRKTEEVVASLLKSDGGIARWWDHPVDHLRKHFLAKNNYEYTNKKDFLKHIVEQHRKQAQIHTNEYLYPIDYANLLDNFEKIVAYFGLQISSQEIEVARKVTAYYAKSFQKVAYLKHS